MNWGMLGHDWAVDLLQKHVANNEVRHAYLFIGSRGVGRRTLALRFAQALNCINPPIPGEPCNKCRICTQTFRMTHPDLSVIQAEQEGGTLKVDQIRDLQYRLSLHPYEAKYRVALLIRFEEANSNAMNALLKTLEEPAPQVILVLTAESVESLLPTIVSRCEVMKLRPLSLDKLTHGLQSGWNLPEENARLLAHISLGRPGYAILFNENPDQLMRRGLWLEEHMNLLQSNRVERFSFAHHQSEDKASSRNKLQVWLSLWRDIFLKATGASVPLVNLDRIQDIEGLAVMHGSKVSFGVVKAIENTLSMLEKNINVRLALEILMLDLPMSATYLAARGKPEKV